mmetsp:Transcript_37133/g.93134  ORF Transcript_37133/g.93134 Transcript_37133/m.93134 type:complete len:87 (-) Transcript_37133:162-422(-)
MDAALSVYQMRNLHVPCSCSNGGKYDKLAKAEIIMKSKPKPGFDPSLATNQKNGRDRILPWSSPAKERLNMLPIPGSINEAMETKQ